MKQIIIAFSGRKGSGKNTLARFVAEHCNMSHYECSFADNLKEFCINTLGLAQEQCYGSDEDKNKPTQYKWENALNFLRWKFSDDPLAQFLVESGYHPNTIIDYYHRLHSLSNDMRQLRSGYMTGRDIMQVFGTDLIRHTFGNVWAHATIRNIKKKGKELSLITDNRFPNEIEVVLQEPCGFIVRLTRSPSGTSDVHPSESALDDFIWNQDRCFVIDNAQMSIEQQNNAVRPIIDKICQDIWRE